MSLDLGTVNTPEEAAACMQGAFESFLRAGGRFTWKDWVGMSEQSRLAAEAAGAAHAREVARIAAEEAAAIEVERASVARADEVLDEVVEEGVLG